MLERFLGRKKQIDVSTIMRRIIDLTTPNHTSGTDLRVERRYNRAFPVLLSPWIRRTLKIDESIVVFTRDLSDRGFGLITPHELDGQDFVITSWPPQPDIMEPYHFLTSLREQRQVAMGIWVAGFEVVDFLNRTNRRDLNRLNQAAACTLKLLNSELVGAED